MSDKDSVFQKLHAGQRFYCLHCKSDSFVQVAHDMQGFRVVAEKLVCAFCKAIIDQPTESVSTTAATAATENTDSSAVLSALLQLDDTSSGHLSVETLLSTPSAAAAEADKPFCRDCFYYIHHPFLSRCSLHNRTVEPMDDCSSFRSNKAKLP